MSSTDTRTVAFIGLGIMGGPMARHLVRAGHDVVGHNRSPGKAEALAADGGRAAATVADAVAKAEVVALMLPDSPDVVDVCTRDGGVFDTAEPGTLVVDFSTIRPDVARDLAARAAERGLRMLDAPVSGGQAGAENAALSVMVGGDGADVAAARPLLDVLGKTVVHVGPSGAGQTVKAANQLIVAGNIALLAEALVFLQAHGADLDAAVEVLGGGLAGSKVLDQKAPTMLAGDYAPGFRIDLHHKDMGIVADSAREAGVVAPVAALVAQLVAATRAAGDGGLDHSALHRTVRRLNGDLS
ncbi:2-hydroxy-3-oxopropionate reductase [Pseudonocardia sp. Ae717_Ps2]|uniref:NAD(P)-dependent oxidoreductase n=1 Tax=Pseudonocardia sp. Ae717_Ps2 TaxID=1885573 RepID=UPI00094B3C87|nr:NAD(P)-dependent oxidoreductase [Pseudonocardia sp. Ae717_Ps2]OLM31453.1 2-hydroxy-3-oxopropionate reductase [Pseudonocardia sp. Ae717_Ps2]